MSFLHIKKGDRREKTDRVKDMTKGNPTRLIFFFALPLILGNLGQQLYMITDTVIVGQGVGLEALAALGATDWIYWLVLWPVQLLTQGFAVLITQNIGEGNEKSIKKSIAMSAILCMVIGSVVSLLFPLLARPLLGLLKTPGDIFNGAHAYVTVMYAGTLIVMAYNMASAVLRAFGDGKTPLIAMIIAAVLNISLDLLLVMGFQWGIVGAAAATIFSQLVAFLYCLLMISKIPAVNMKREDWKPDGLVIKRLLKLGTPLAFSHVAIVIGGIILQFVINGFGSLFIAAFTATNKLYGLLESSATSFGFATSTYMGQNWGARNPERIRMGMRSAVKLATVFSIAISVLMLLFGRYLLMMFISSEDANAPAVLELAYQYLTIMSVTLLILYALHVYRAAIQGMGNTIIPMLAGLLECVGRVSVALLLPKIMGEYGLFFAESTAWLFSAVCVTTAYYAFVRKMPVSGIKTKACTCLR
ncbi:MATE family efflux transporter [bacterium 1XD21-13]|nr:MATE family efflux transporter [bacterium 1XD21-13]